VDSAIRLNLSRSEALKAKQELEQSTLIRDAVESEKRTLTLERDTLSSQREGQIAETAVALAEIASLTASLAHTASERDSLARQLESLELEYKHLALERDSLREQRDTLIGEKSALDAKLAAASVEIEALMAHIAGLNGEQERLARDKESLEAECETRRQENVVLNAHLETQNGAMLRQTQLNDALRQVLHVAELDLHKSRAEQSALLDRFHELEATHKRIFGINRETEAEVTSQDVMRPADYMAPLSRHGFLIDKAITAECGSWLKVSGQCDGNNIAIWGPYKRLAPGKYVLSAQFRAILSLVGRQIGHITIDVFDADQDKIITETTISAIKCLGDSEIELGFIWTEDQFMHRIEFRLHQASDLKLIFYGFRLAQSF
jgi:hypothetical protein